MKEKKLFIVEFGEPNIGMFTSKQSSVFVIANDYNEAASKALIYEENKRNLEKSKNILTGDGSLNRDVLNNDEIKISAIKFAGEVIF